MQNATTTHAAVTWLQDRQDKMVGLLAELVNTDSNSRDKLGVDSAGTVLAHFFMQRGILVDTVPQLVSGDVLRVPVSQPEARNPRPIVLMGHRDTVFPKGEARRRPFRIEGDRAYGPGVADMKAGLVINAFVLAAYHAVGGHPGPLLGLITSDEEIASPACRPIIEQEARQG